MNSEEVVNKATTLLNQPQHASGLAVSELLALLQQKDPATTRGQVLNLLNKVKWRKVKNIAVTLNKKGTQMFIRADPFHQFQVDFNSAYEHLASQAQVIASQLTEDQQEAVNAAIKAMCEHCSHPLRINIKH
ncbi:hypothetical protein [Lacticaseibacillus paracasei]|uniref:hypothetical protein n=1 Tax=Lacticaseibacillus paracasei TaxID=1597 RepID=UPI0036D3EF22